MDHIKLGLWFTFQREVKLLEKPKYSKVTKIPILLETKKGRHSKEVKMESFVVLQLDPYKSHIRPSEICVLGFKYRPPFS